MLAGGVERLKQTSSISCSIRARKRLARLLLLLANFGKEGKPEPVITKISQEALAEMIGTELCRFRRAHAGWSARDAALPLILLTGHGDIPMAVNAILAGFSPIYYPKRSVWVVIFPAC